MGSETARFKFRAKFIGSGQRNDSFDVCVDGYVPCSSFRVFYTRLSDRGNRRILWIISSECVVNHHVYHCLYHDDVMAWKPGLDSKGCPISKSNLIWPLDNLNSQTGCPPSNTKIQGNWYPNRPISQIPQCIRQISHNARPCNRNVHTCAHFCCKMVHRGIFVWCIVGYVRWVYS